MTALISPYQGPAEPRGALQPPTILEALWRFKALVVASMVVFGVIAYGYAARDSGVWTARTRIALTAPARNGGSIDNLNRYSSEQAVFAKSRSVMDRASASLGEPLAVVQANVSVTSQVSGGFLVVTATARDRALAKRRSDQVASAYEAASKDLADAHTTEQKKALNAAETRALATIASAPPTPNRPAGDLTASASASALTQLYLREADLDTEAARFGSGVEYIEPAHLPTARTTKQQAVTTGIGALLGLFLAALLAWARADRLRSADDVLDPAVLLHAPLLGEIPDLSGRNERRTLVDVTAMPALGYEFVAASLAGTFPTGVLLVTGAERGAGSSVSALNLAVAGAREGRRVVVVDADNMTKSLSLMTGTSNAGAGISDVVAGRADLADAYTTVALGSETLSVIPAGADESDIASIYRNRHTEQLLDALRAQHELVVIDCPPLVTNPEAASLARFANGILVVVRSGTKVRLLERLEQRLAVLPAPLVGYVFTRGRSELQDARSTPQAQVRLAVE